MDTIKIPERYGRAAPLIAITSTLLFWVLYLSRALYGLVEWGMSGLVADVFWILTGIIALIAGVYGARQNTGAIRSLSVAAAIIGWLQLVLWILAMFITSM